MQAHADAEGALSRRHFLQGMGVAAGALAVAGVTSWADAAEVAAVEQPFPGGAALRVKPILVFDVPTPKEQDSWRSYGAIQTPAAARAWVKRMLAQ